jgi:D-3-phosphoglycerate dehydrogenase
MTVKVFTRTPPSVGFPPGISASSSLIDLAGECDHLSLHLPLTSQTNAMINEPVLRAMRPNAVLLNTARGPIVDSGALRRAVVEGWIAGAGLDVLDADPPAPGNALIGLDNVVVTPHAAFNSVESLTSLRRQAATNVMTALGGDVPAAMVNPEVLHSSALRLRRKVAAHDSH